MQKVMMLVLLIFLVSCAKPIDDVAVPEEVVEPVVEEPTQEVPTIEEPEVEEAVVEETTEPTEVPESVEEEIPAAEEQSTQLHTITITNDGFKPDTIYIKRGDTVTWVNERTSTKTAMIIGTQNCRNVKRNGRNAIIATGESFTYTFATEEFGRCPIVDGIQTSMVTYIYIQ